MKNPEIWSLGHSNIDFETFVTRVRSQDIECIADVRSLPYSRYTPHFNQESLSQLLDKSGVRYEFMGDTLGGRPPELDLYDQDGHVLYGELAKNFRFQSGLEQLCLMAEESRTAMMCSEESPQNCHRRLLIGRVLREQGIEVVHIHGNCTTSTDSELLAKYGPHEVATLFGVESEPWRSIRPVLQSGRPKGSSND